MSSRLDALLEFLRREIFEPLGRLIAAAASGARVSSASAYRRRWRLGIAALLALLAYGLYAHPPFATVRRGEVLVRTDVLDGSVTVYSRGHRARAARHPSGALLLHPRSGVSAGRERERHRAGALPVDRGLIDRRRSDGALGHRSRSPRADVEGISGRPERRPRCARRCRGSSTRCSPDIPCARSSPAGAPRSSRRS